jgi:hypothetical protein
MTHDDVQAWLDRYLQAWLTYDPTLIAGLFAAEAEYRYHPWDEPEKGREAILRDWLEPGGAASSRDLPGTYAGHYEPWVVDGHRAVAVGTSTYWTDATQAEVARVYHNLWLLEFDADGFCTSFVEWYMQPKHPPAAAPES